MSSFDNKFFKFFRTDLKHWLFGENTCFVYLNYGYISTGYFRIGIVKSKYADYSSSWNDTWVKFVIYLFQFEKLDRLTWVILTNDFDL